MDQPGLDREPHLRALAGLARINAWSASLRILWLPVRRLLHRASGRPLRLLDLASGAGDLPIGLWQRARDAGFDLEVEGWDVRPTAVDFARGRASRRGAGVRFVVADALGGPLPDGFDVITTSLFLHHLDDGRAVQLLSAMGRAARQLVLVNDLARCRAGLALAWAGTRLLSRSEVVRADGPMSVRAAFTCGEALALAGRAGLRGAVVARRWPCRFLLSWSPLGGQGDGHA